MRLSLIIIAIVSACIAEVVNTGLAQEPVAEQLVTLLGEIRKIVDEEKSEGNRFGGLVDLAEIQARAGVHKEAEETFDAYSASLWLGQHSDKANMVEFQIRLLSKMSLASKEAGDHNAAVGYLRKAFLLAQSKPARGEVEMDAQMISSRKAKLQQVSEIALRLQVPIVADEVAASAHQMISTLPGKGSDKSIAQAEFWLNRARVQLSLGQKDPARNSIQILLTEFREHIIAYPCNELPGVAALQAELGDIKTAMDNMNRCFAWRDRRLKDHPKDDPDDPYDKYPPRYRFYNSRDLASVAAAAWRGGNQSQATELFEKALILGRTTPFDDQVYYWRQLTGVAGEMKRFDVIEEAVCKGYHNDDWTTPWYPDLMRQLLDADRHDLFRGLSRDEDYVEALVHLQVERGDYRGALKAGEGVSVGSGPSCKMVRDLTRAYAAFHEVQETVNWSARWKNHGHRCSLLGVADYLISEQRS